MLCTLTKYNSSEQIKKTERDRARNTYGTDEVHTGVWWGNLREGDHLKTPDIDGRIILTWISEKWAERTWTGLMWLMIGTGGRL
jgi:hypothetical protein